MLPCVHLRGSNSLGQLRLHYVTLGAGNHKNWEKSFLGEKLGEAVSMALNPAASSMVIGSNPRFVLMIQMILRLWQEF